MTVAGGLERSLELGFSTMRDFDRTGGKKGKWKLSILSEIGDNMSMNALIPNL